MIDEGRGDDVIVLVHGHPFDRTMWRPQVEAIVTAGWRVIAPDLRGYGEHGASTLGATLGGADKTMLDRFAQDLMDILDARGIARAVFGGLSMGGQIVMACCHHHPERVRGIVLAATFAHADTDDAKRNRRAMADRLLREGMDGYAAETLPKMIAPHNITALPHVAEHVHAMMRNAPPAGAAAALRGRAERPDYQDTLARTNVPALIVAGDHDAFTTRADAERMRDLLTQAQAQVQTQTQAQAQEQVEFVWLEGSGHMPNLERAADFNAALVRFLRSVSSRPDEG